MSARKVQRKSALDDRSDADLSFFGKKTQDTQAGKQIPLTQIDTADWQPRRYFDEAEMAKLVASVKKNGIMQPVLVRPHGQGRYELIAGERRYRAAREAGLQDIPVTIRELSDEEAAELALMENLQREDLNPVEETEGVLELLKISQGISKEETISLLNQAANAEKRGKILTNNVIRQLETIEKVFTVVGINSWQSFRANRLPVLNLPEDILTVLLQGKIQYTKAREIARVKDEKKRRKLLEQAIAEKWSLNDIKAQTKALKEQKQPKRSNKAKKLLDRIDAVHKQAKKASLDDADVIREAEELLLKLEALLRA